MFGYASLDTVDQILPKIGNIVLTIINGTFKWYALHSILVRGWLITQFTIVSTTMVHHCCTHMIDYKFMFEGVTIKRYMLEGVTKSGTC